MDASVDNIEFRGEDAEECNKFMLHVLKHAFTTGKQRDDEWVADFAATCLAGEALRWWTGLPPPTQGSWTLLRQAMTQRYRPSFYGRSGEEAEKFVHLVYERALDAERQGDNQWIVEFVPTCFKGEALRWFSSLDTTVRNDWGLLQKALFRQFPTADVSGLSRLSPTPAAVGAPANPEKPLNLKRGRVRVAHRNSGIQQDLYLSNTLDPDGKVSFTGAFYPDGILQVDCDPTCDDLQELFIPDNQFGQYDLLAIRWYEGDTVDNDSLGTLCAVNSKTSLSSTRLSTKPVLRNPWKIVPDSAPERAIIIPTGEAGQLGSYLQIEGLYFFSKLNANRVSFIFEPL